jgi:hypothetical protein
MNIYNKKRYFDLLEYSNNLRKSEKVLYYENKEAFLELLSYQVIIENEVFWQSKDQFVLLMLNFINETLDAIEFKSEFFAITRQNQNLYESFERNFEKLENFKVNPKSEGFSTLIEEIFSDCDMLNLDTEYNQTWLKECVKDALLKIQKYL